MTKKRFPCNLKLMFLFEKIPSVVYSFAAEFRKNGFACYPVGGAVRDLLLGKRPTDFDFTTDARPEAVMKLFRSVIPTGIKHGTVTVLYKKQSFEVTSFRSEEAYSDGRHPDRVSFDCTLEEDLKRRDFTINALALDLEKRKIIDLFDGAGDLRRGIIRCIGNPEERFREDALRLLRAARFASRLLFSIETSTATAMKQLAPTVSRISVERIRDELMKILASPRPSVGVEILRESGILAVILPEIIPCIGFEQNEYHRFDVYNHLLKACDYLPSDSPLLRLTALLHDIGKPDSFAVRDGRRTFYRHEQISADKADAILHRLKFSNNEIDSVLFFIRNHMIHYTEEWSDSAVRRFMATVPPEKRRNFFALKEADAYAHEGMIPDPLTQKAFLDRIEKCESQNAALSLKDLAVNGNDLAAAGFPKTRQMGQILHILLEAVLDDPKMNTKEKLLKLAVNYKKEFMPEN